MEKVIDTPAIALIVCAFGRYSQSINGNVLSNFSVSGKEE
jgi:hypothetical protein